jgi:hypothetical protein
VRLPRDLSGVELAHALKRFGYQVTRQTGSHMRLSSNFKGNPHHLKAREVKSNALERRHLAFWGTVLIGK